MINSHTGKPNQLWRIVNCEKNLVTSAKLPLSSSRRSDDHLETELHKIRSSIEAIRRQMNRSKQDSVEDNFPLVAKLGRCELCKNKEKDVAQTCGHRSCSSCLEGLEARSENCPFCSTSLNGFIHLFN